MALRKGKPDLDPYNFDAPGSNRTRWKTVLVIVCALILGLLLGLMMRGLI